MPALERVNNLSGARKAKLPAFIAPQLATLVREPPSGDEFLHELKFDGYRMLCRIDRGKVTFWSRNEKEWTGKFANVEESVKLLPLTTAILDGEIVIVDAQGQSSFQKLQRAMGKGTNSGFVYQVFDLIYLDGYNLTRVTLKERKRLLKELCSRNHGTIRYSEHLEGNGDAFFKHACEYGIEGIVSKLADSTYDSTRNRSWLKVKCNKQQEFVIAGYTPTEKGLPGFGALVLGVYDSGKLVYAGRVGTGFTFKERGDLKKQLVQLSRPSSPFAVQPKDRGLRDAQWVEPKLVGEVVFAEWTSDGSIRHPSFQGLREDKKAKDVVRELAAAMPPVTKTKTPALPVTIKERKLMAKNTGTGSRKGAVKGRTQVKNPKTNDFVKRDEAKGSPTKGQFKDVKEDGKPFKGIAKEPDKRRKKS